MTNSPGVYGASLCLSRDLMFTIHCSRWKSGALLLRGAELPKERQRRWHPDAGRGVPGRTALPRTSAPLRRAAPHPVCLNAFCQRAQQAHSHIVRQFSPRRPPDEDPQLAAIDPDHAWCLVEENTIRPQCGECNPRPAAGWRSRIDIDPHATGSTEFENDQTESPSD